MLAIERHAGWAGRTGKPAARIEHAAQLWAAAFAILALLPSLRSSHSERAPRRSRSTPLPAIREQPTELALQLKAGAARCVHIVLSRCPARPSNMIMILQMQPAPLLTSMCEAMI